MPAGYNRVARLVRQAQLRGVSRRRWVCTTQRDRRARPAPDLVQRRFSAELPDQLWVADITYSTPSQRSPPVLGVELLEHVWNACSVKWMLR